MAKNFTTSVRGLGFSVETTHCSAWTWYKATKNGKEITFSRYSKHGEQFVSFNINGVDHRMTDQMAIQYLEQLSK